MEDKPWTNSKTVLSAIVGAAATAIGILFPEYNGVVIQLVQVLAGFGIIYGVRDAIGSNK